MLVFGALFFGGFKDGKFMKMTRFSYCYEIIKILKNVARLTSVRHFNISLNNLFMTKLINQ